MEGTTREGAFGRGTFAGGVDDAARPTTPEVLIRPRLLTVVNQRWTRPMTAVIGGAGFGKTTLLAQTLEQNRGSRIGTDIPIRLEPADASASRFATRLMTALGVPAPRLTDAHDLADVLVEACWSRAPTPICLVLDDVHHVPADSQSVAFLRRVVETLPGNVHVLVGSRSLPPIGAARLAALGEAVVLRESDLGFTPTEVGEFARLRSVPVDRVSPADGWPALAELLAGATGVEPDDYVWEEVVSLHGEEERSTLVQIAALGGADDMMATAVAGHPVRLDELLVDVPFAVRSGAGWWELHDVVAEPVLRREAPAGVAEIRRRGGLYARAQGEMGRALVLLVAAEAWDDVLETLRAEFVRLGAPADLTTAADCAVLLPASLAGAPEVMLVQTIAAMVTDPGRAFELGESAVAAFAARGDVDGEVAALARLGGIAFNLSDSGRFLPYVGRIAELAAAGHPWAIPLDAMCRGALLIMSGDLREAETVLAPVVADPTRDPTQGLGAYLCGAGTSGERSLRRGGSHDRSDVRR